MSVMAAVESYLAEYRHLCEAFKPPPYTRLFISALDKALHRVDKQVAKELAAGRLDFNDIRRADQAIKSAFGRTKDQFTSAYETFTFKAASAGRDAAIRQFDLGLRFDMVNEYAQEQLTQHAFKASERTMARMAGDVMATLQKCHRDGLSIFEIRQSLAQDFQGMRSYQLDRISRTELHSASQKGASLAYTEAGVEYEEWVTAQDDRVRGTPGGKWEEGESDHSEMHGQIVRTGTPFRHPIEGWESMFPGDRDTGAPISAWIQCRCRLVPFWMPQGKAAPEGLRQFTRDDLVLAPTPDQGTVEVPDYSPAPLRSIDDWLEVDRVDGWSQDQIARTYLPITNKGNQLDVEIARIQGFDKLPQVIPSADLDDLIAKGARELHRGVTQTVQGEQFQTGDLFIGQGVYGSGTYTAYGRKGLKIAKEYAGHEGDGVILRMALRADAKVIDIDALDAVVEKTAIELVVQRRAAVAAAEQTGRWGRVTRMDTLHALVADRGRLATALGYDAIDVPKYQYVVVLNRTAVQVAKELIRP